MPGTVEVVEAYQCSACEAVVAADEVDFDDVIYECGTGCGSFLRSDADGSNRCPQCNKFGSRAEEGPPCPECREGAMEPVGKRFQANLDGESETFTDVGDAREWIDMAPKRKAKSEAQREDSEARTRNLLDEMEREWQERRQHYPALVRLLSIAGGADEDSSARWTIERVQDGYDTPKRASWVGQSVTLDIDDAIRLARYVGALEALMGDVDRYLLASAGFRGDEAQDTAMAMVGRWERLMAGQLPEEEGAVG